jgi:hypothetical protein
MQASVRPKPILPRVIVFPDMADRKQKTAPPTRAPKFSPSTFGTVAQLASAVLSLAAILLTLYFHYEADTSKALDDHVSLIVADKIDTAVRGVNTGIDQKLEPLIRKIDDLSSKVADAEGQLKRLRASDPQASRRELTAIRAEIKSAQNNSVQLQPAKLEEYRAAVRSIPSTTAQYWSTVAAIVNYRSFLDQMNHNAPDPSVVSRQCPGITNAAPGASFNNSYAGINVSDCIVDLDTNSFQRSTFRDSVIRYHGGPVFLEQVQFLNCRFLLDLPSTPVATPPRPQADQILMALLDAPDQKHVTLTAR